MTKNQFLAIFFMLAAIACEVKDKPAEAFRELIVAACKFLFWFLAFLFMIWVVWP